jgi:hypothetical protein
LTLSSRMWAWGQSQVTRHGAHKRQMEEGRSSLRDWEERRITARGTKGRPSRLWLDWDEGRCKDRRKKEDRPFGTGKMEETPKDDRFALNTMRCRASLGKWKMKETMGDGRPSFGLRREKNSSRGLRLLYRFHHLSPISPHPSSPPVPLYCLLQTFTKTGFRFEGELR